jgi:L-fuconolactonase
VTRIDAHQHFWHFRAEEYPWIDEHMSTLRRDRLPDALQIELHREAFDGCIAVQARTRPEETDYLLGFAARCDWIAAVVGWIDLRADDIAKQLEGRQGQRKVRGFRHPLQDEPDSEAYMNDARFRRGLQCLQARGYVYEVLVRQSQLDAAVAMCAEVDAHWLVLDHLGKPSIREGDHAAWARSIQPLRHMPHVVCKLSGLVTEADRGDGRISDGEIRPYLDAAVEIFGTERLLYGSDWPVCLLSASYARVHGIIHDWAQRLSPSEQAALWGGTALRTYGLQSLQTHGLAGDA